VAVQVAAGGRDHVLHELVGVAGRLAAFERDPARAVRRLVLRDEQQRDPVLDRIQMLAGTLQLVARLDERAAVAGAGEVG
jgi:hypothetical protein